MVGLVCCAAGGIEQVRAGFVEPALARGWRVAVSLTPTAATWLRAAGEVDRLAALTGLPVRWTGRLPTEPRPHPPADCWVVAPATANSVAQLALGLAPNQALTPVTEALGTGVPVVVFPRVNAAHAAHPAWAGHLATLRRAGVRLIDGADWPLHPPGTDPPDRPLPWPAIQAAVAGSLTPG